MRAAHGLQDVRQTSQVPQVSIAMQFMLGKDNAFFQLTRQEQANDDQRKRKQHADHGELAWVGKSIHQGHGGSKHAGHHTPVCDPSSKSASAAR
jgi:hypothetical protein